jgi:hypothetical protein
MCYQPVEIRVPYKETEENKGLRLLNGESNSSYMLVPCRQCLACRQKRAREWALRCVFEAGQHLHNCFITLTYEKSPVVLVKRDLQLFIKRLRKKISPIKIKYFACGEYGDLRLRPHFHMIIFGYDFPDKYEEGNSNSGYRMFKSETLDTLWGHGLTCIQDVTINSASYCALYASEKRTTLPPHLWDFPEFNVMSLGLGVKPMLENFETYLLTDEIWFDGKKHNIPQVILEKCLDKESAEYKTLKANRVEKSVRKEELVPYADEKYRHENKRNRLTRSLDKS